MDYKAEVSSWCYVRQQNVGKTVTKMYVYNICRPSVYMKHECINVALVLCYNWTTCT